MGSKQFTALFLLLVLLPAFALAARPKAGDGSAGMVDGVWVPPIGIPEPDFGIYETYRMYDDDSQAGPRNPDLDYRENAEGGYYTHYVDNTHPAATDVDNPYGSPGKPRMTLVSSSDSLVSSPLVPGSVVEVHGGPYDYVVKSPSSQGNTRLAVIGNGTREQPIFVRGLNSDNKPVFLQPIMVEADYIIFENLDAAGFEAWPISWEGHEVNHVSIRNNEIHKEELRGSGVSIGWPHGDNEEYQHPTRAHDIVVYNNEIHDMGKVNWDDWIGAGDPGDSYGVYVHHNAYKTWVVDNHIYNIDGAGVHLNTWHIDDASQFPPTLTYIGRNEIHHNRESCITAKVAHDTITSENKLYDIHKSIGAVATALVVESDHETVKYPYQKRAWHLFNEIYDSDRGVRVLDSSDIYLIGNVIHDIVTVDSLTNDPWAAGGGYAVGGYRTRDVTIYNNVIYNSDFGIVNAGNRVYSELHIANNIIFNLTDNFFEQFSEYPYQIWIGSGSGVPDRSTMNNNLLFQGEDPLHIGWNLEYPSISDFQAGTGAGEGCVEADPEFVAPQNNDFSLASSNSPAVDAGLESDVYAEFERLYPDAGSICVDFDGNPRPLGEWDIGAFEFQGSVCVDMQALLNYISQWRQGSITMPSIISRLAAWKSGEGC